jgi:molybdopterin-guanine dinucleotide biosynthesis protein A
MPRSSVCNEAPPVLGLVLAGGRSRRFGRDKAGIEIDGQALLARIFTLVDSVVERVFVSVRADQVDEALRKHYSLIVDEQPELGPAGGILAAHAHSPDAAWFVIACDMPLLDERSIRLLIESRRAEKAGTGYRSPLDGLPEPLCAIWEPATLETFRQRVESGGSLSPRDMLADANVELIDAADARALANVNTPADFERLKRGDSDT